MADSDIVWEPEPEPVLDVVSEPPLVEPNSTFASRKAARLAQHKAVQAAENK